jgi:hypothetical protein
MPRRAFDDDSFLYNEILAQHTSVAIAGDKAAEEFHRALANRDVIGQAKGIITGIAMYNLHTLGSDVYLRFLVETGYAPAEVSESSSASGLPTRSTTPSWLGRASSNPVGGGAPPPPSSPMASSCVLLI